MSGDQFQWPFGNPPDLRDGPSHKDVIDGLYAPTALRMDNRVPGGSPTFMAVCAPTDEQRLIVVVCDRPDTEHPWTIRGARDATDDERKMWREHTS